MVATIAVCELPPSESRNKCVKTESRYGTHSVPPVLLSESVEITFPSVNNDLLIAAPSFNLELIKLILMINYSVNYLTGYRSSRHDLIFQNRLNQ